ncbi:aldo/keto reductase, partial [Bacteroidales bacterium OttesenSCG-928-I21]|nr:aldo/keto reductase [Bacteroidales bacterium OttesenSCG-928-I21]
GSRKYLMSSLDQSLRRMGIDYVDIFYSHRFDPFTPIEETVQALIDIVRQGKALYVGISNYPVEETQKALWLLNEQRVPCLIYQGKYNIFLREAEYELFSVLKESGVGYIAFSPLAQGLLTDKYLKGIPKKSRAANPHGFLEKGDVTKEVIGRVSRLNEIAKKRGQSLSQMAIAWTLRKKNVTSSLIGASSVAQLKNNIEAIKNISFSEEEIWQINEIVDY